MIVVGMKVCNSLKRSCKKGMHYFDGFAGPRINHMIWTRLDTPTFELKRDRDAITGGL